MKLNDRQNAVLDHLLEMGTRQIAYAEDDTQNVTLQIRSKNGRTFVLVMHGAGWDIYQPCGDTNDAKLTLDALEGWLDRGESMLAPVIGWVPLPDKTDWWALPDTDVGVECDKGDVIPGSRGYACTREAGHGGPHVAHDTSHTVVHVWDDKGNSYPRPGRS